MDRPGHTEEPKMSETNTEAMAVHRGAYGRTSPGMADELAKQQPVTAEIMDRTRVARNTAFEVVGRLRELRDRLLGVAPVPGNPIAAKPVGDHFSAAYADVADQLEEALANIDRISLELANRL